MIKYFSPFALVVLIGPPTSVEIIVPVGICDGGCLWWGALASLPWWKDVQVIGCPLNWPASGC